MKMQILLNNSLTQKYRLLRRNSTNHQLKVQKHCHKRLVKAIHAKFMLMSNSHT